VDDQSLANGRASGPRHIAEKPNDARQERRARPVEFPVSDGAMVNAEPLSELALEEDPTPSVSKSDFGGASQLATQ
jgi:hypothetical protein